MNFQFSQLNTDKGASWRIKRQNSKILLGRITKMVHFACKVKQPYLGFSRVQTSQNDHRALIILKLLNINTSSIQYKIPYGKKQRKFFPHFLEWHTCLFIFCSCFSFQNNFSYITHLADQNLHRFVLWAWNKAELAIQYRNSNKYFINNQTLPHSIPVEKCKHQITQYLTAYALTILSP